MRDFLWDGGDLAGGEHLVDWKAVCLAKDKGGLGIGNLEKRNKVLLMKWLWRFPKENQSLWYKVIKSRVGLHPNLWDSKTDDRGTFRSPWKAISSLYREFHQLVSFKVGNGNKVRFWEDAWAGENPLQVMFPSLFRLSSLKSHPISDFHNQSGPSFEGVTSWNLHFSRNLLDREIDQLIQLIQILETKRVCSTVVDRREWKGDFSGVFSCKSAFVWMRNDNALPLNFPTKTIWKTSVPAKVKVFIWLLVLGKVNVHTTMQKRRPYHYLSPGWCVLCKKENKSIDHLFLHCQFSFRLWCKIVKEFNREWVTPRSCIDLLGLGNGFFLNKKGKAPWKVATIATLWAVWLERNNRVFEEKEEVLEYVWDRIKLWVEIWLHDYKDFKRIPFYLLLRDWNPF